MPATRDARGKGVIGRGGIVWNNAPATRGSIARYGTAVRIDVKRALSGPDTRKPLALLSAGWINLQIDNGIEAGEPHSSGALRPGTEPHGASLAHILPHFSTALRVNPAAG